MVYLLKMVIADNLSTYVDTIYENTADFTSLSILTGVFFYSFQIYSDFYGYSIIAIGTALIMGISLMDNFRTPYLSKNISEFWQRWHISLSTWFKDYLYFPLGGSRTSKARWMLNISVVFLISGIWHGANWTFVFWGFLYALVYLLESNLKIKSKIRETRFVKVLLIFKTFILVSFIWIFFRSQTIQEAFNLLKYLLVNTSETLKSLDVKLFVWILLFSFILLDSLLSKKRFDKYINTQNGIIRWLIYTFLIASILMFSGVEDHQFIYFQF